MQSSGTGVASSAEAGLGGRQRPCAPSWVAPPVVPTGPCPQRHTAAVGFKASCLADRHGGLIWTFGAVHENAPGGVAELFRFN